MSPARANPRTPPDYYNVSYPSGPTLSRGSIVCIDSGAPALADVSADAAFEFVGALLRDVTAGETASIGLGTKQLVLAIAGLTVAKGDRVWLSATAGSVTNVLPTSGNLIELGTILDTSAYAADQTLTVRFERKTIVDLG